MKNYFKYFILLLTILLLSGCKLFSKNEDVKPINSVVSETNSEVKLEKMNYCEDCDDTIVELPVPQQEGYIFEGWFADKELTQKVDVASNKLTDAVWKDNPPTGDSIIEYIVMLLLSLFGFVKLKRIYNCL